MKTGEEQFRKTWSKKTVRQLEKEIDSWQRYMQKHSGSYGWVETNPNEMNDSDKLTILREIHSEKKARGEG